MIGIEGSIGKREKPSKKCLIHPMCKEGQCGNYFGFEHGTYPVGKEPKPSQPFVSKEDKEDIIHEVLSYRVTRHRIIALTEAQFKAFKKKDVYGVVEIAKFIKPGDETPVQKALRSREIPDIIA